jgi:hypothetical protein
MTTDRSRRDARLAAARYQAGGGVPSDEQLADEASEAGRLTPDQRAGMVEIAIQQAMRRGEFDDLPGLGQPLPDLEQAPDPDWWIRRKIEREGLTGLGPPALALRKEDADLSSRMDAAGSEATVRKLLEDFNARVIEARRQLLGGPPVITPTRDIDAEVAAWRERRETRLRAISAKRERERAALAAMSWRERRRARRQG